MICITVPLWGKSNDDQVIPLTYGSDTENVSIL